MILDFFFFFFTFLKKWVGRAMGNETFYGDALIGGSNSIFNSLSPESDQCQIFPCIITALKKQIDHEN